MPHGHKHSTAADRRQLRELVRSVPCPHCHAEAYDKCRGHVRKSDGAVYIRIASHAERWELYREYVAQKNQPKN